MKFVRNQIKATHDKDFKSLRLSSLTTVSNGDWLLPDDSLCLNTLDRDLGVDGAMGAVLVQENRNNICRFNNPKCEEELVTTVELPGAKVVKRPIVRFCRDFCWDEVIGKDSPLKSRTNKELIKDNQLFGLRSMYCHINVAFVRSENDCPMGGLCVGGCNYTQYEPSLNWDRETLQVYKGTLARGFMQKDYVRLDQVESQLNRYIATTCSACNWKEALALHETDHNTKCYSRHLHGNYTYKRGGYQSSAAFYNGCPAKAPWRGGLIDDLSITASLIEHRNFNQDDCDENDLECLKRDLAGFGAPRQDRHGWVCLTRDQCEKLDYLIFHCDDLECMSGTCHQKRDTESEVWDAATKSTLSYVEPTECRYGFGNESAKTDGDIFNPESIVCKPNNSTSRVCHFKEKLLIKEKADLYLLGDCTEIRMPGGLVISDYTDSVEHLRVALQVRVSASKEQKSTYFCQFS